MANTRPSGNRICGPISGTSPGGPAGSGSAVLPALTHWLVAMTYFCALGMLLHCTAKTVPSGSNVQPSSEFESRLLPPADQLPDSGSQIAVKLSGVLSSLPSKTRPSGRTQDDASPIFVQPTGVAIGVQTSVTGS